MIKLKQHSRQNLMVDRGTHVFIETPDLWGDNKMISGDKMKKKRIAGLSLFAAAVISVALFQNAAVPQNTKPNFVVFMIDDLDTRLFQEMLAQGLLPAINTHIVSRGVHFTNAYATDAICCPSRATFFSGQYVQNHGVLDITKGYGYIYGISASGQPAVVDPTGQGGDTTFLSAWLKNAGYRTGLAGKYLNKYLDLDGDGVPDPNKPSGWDSWTALFGDAAYNMYEYTYVKDSQVHTGPAVTADAGVNQRNFQTTFITNEALSFLNVSPRDPQYQKPFFLYLAPTAPHTEGGEQGPPGVPYQTYYALTLPEHPKYPLAEMADWAAGKTWNISKDSPGVQEWINAQLDDKPSWFRSTLGSPGVPAYSDRSYDLMNGYYQSRVSNMRGIDDMVGAVAASLQQSGKYDNTYLILVSDNGYFLGEHGLTQKAAIYEEATHVPLLIAGPGVVPNQRSSALVVNNDLAVTIARAAGATPDPQRLTDGRDLTPLLRNPSAFWDRRQVLIERYADAVGVTPVDIIPPYRALRRLDQKSSLNDAFVAYQNPDGSYYEGEYYDLVTDPYQLNNIYGSLSQRSRTDLYSNLEKFEGCKGTACQDAERGR